MKKQRRDISGVLLFDKSTGLSSNSALQQVKRLYNAEKTGHTGTLDPLASGLLPLMFGQATKFAADMIDAHKSYVATVRLGFSSTTGDAEGEIQPVQSLASLDSLGESDVLKAMESLQGEIEQTPPVYSALKKDGRPLYEYARKGLEVDIQPRKIQIFSLKLREFVKEDNELSIEFEAKCSKGTYIRTLGEDLAKALGTQGYLTALRRTQIGGLDVSQALTLSGLQALFDKAGQDGLDAALAPVDSLLSSLPAQNLDLELGKRFLHGQRLPLPANSSTPSGRVRVYALQNSSKEDDNAAMFLGTGTLETDGRGALLRPERLIQVDL